LIVVDQAISVLIEVDSAAGCLVSSVESAPVPGTNNLHQEGSVHGQVKANGLGFSPEGVQGWWVQVAQILFKRSHTSIRIEDHQEEVVGSRFCAHRNQPVGGLGTCKRQQSDGKYRCAEESSYVHVSFYYSSKVLSGYCKFEQASSAPPHTSPLFSLFNSKDAFLPHLGAEEESIPY